MLPVTNCADDGPGSLRAAAAAANDNDEIDLSQLTCSRITLTTGAIEIDADTLTLTGPGRYLLSLDGNHLDRVLIHPADGALTVKGLTIENGHDRATGFHVDIQVAVVVQQVEQPLEIVGRDVAFANQ